MTALKCIVYVSASLLPLKAAQLDELLGNARAFNETVDVTGVLLHNNGTFFQYFEGPAYGVEHVYERIRASGLHAGIVELVNEPIAQREFADWRMGFCEMPQSALQALSDSEWRTSLDRIERKADRSAGLDLLLEYVATAHIDYR